MSVCNSRSTFMRLDLSSKLTLALSSQLLQCKHLPERQMKALCDRVRDILLEESNVKQVSSPVTVCGDIHGQFWDVHELLKQGGMVPDTSYIFMVSPVCRILGAVEFVEGLADGCWTICF